MIWIGDRKTRKKDVIERMSRQELTEEAIEKVKKEKEKEAERQAAEKEEALNGGRKSSSMPRLSLDRFAAGGVSKKGEKGEGPAQKEAHKEKDTLKEEPELFAP